MTWFVVEASALAALATSLTSYGATSLGQVGTGADLVTLEARIAEASARLTA